MKSQPAVAGAPVEVQPDWLKRCSIGGSWHLMQCQWTSDWVPLRVPSCAYISVRLQDLLDLQVLNVLTTGTFP